MRQSHLPALLMLALPALVVVRASAQTGEQRLAGPPPEAGSDTQTFADVPPGHPYYDEIEALYRAGYTAGCATDPLLYCPDATMNRAESAVFVERGIHGIDGLPPQPTSQTFADVPLDSWAAKWVEALWQDGYTAGCGTDPLIYCPWQGHTRAEACVFYLRMLNGPAFVPEQPNQQTFADVPLDTWSAKWVQAAYQAGLIPACETSPELRFCPDAPLSRGLAAYMMVQAKGLLPVPTPQPTPPSLGLLPWGAMYASVEESDSYGMTGIVTASHRDVGTVLAQARARGMRVIVTLGPAAECSYYSSLEVFDYARALGDLNGYLDQVFTQVSYQQLESYIADGTLAAVRVFDEVHNAGACGSGYGLEYSLEWCGPTGMIASRSIRSLPVGTDSQPGFADLLHQLKKRLPENVVIGSTSVPSYMVLVAERMNVLRSRESLPPLPDKSILAYAGFAERGSGKNHDSAKVHFECYTQQTRGHELIYFLANRSAHYEPDNYIWFEDYMRTCQAEGVDFVTSWSWYSGDAGPFQERIEDLADGGVTNGTNTIRLEDVRSGCSRPLIPPALPSSTPLSTHTAPPTSQPTATPTIPPTAQPTPTSQPSPTATPVPSATPVIPPATGFVIDHTSVNADAIPQAWLDQARSLDVFFAHKSVGNNIMLGVADLEAQNYARYHITRTSSPSAGWFDSQDGIGDSSAGFGSNGDPASKVDGFNNRMRNEGLGSRVDVAFMKFCMGDFIPWTSVPADTIWEDYRDMMAGLEHDYPSVTFVWFTSPIVSSQDARGNDQKARFNALVRSYAAQNGRPLFDIADIESHDPSGDPVTDPNGYEAMYNGYTSDGGHLNEASRQRVAKGLWWLLARLAGWSP